MKVVCDSSVLIGLTSIDKLGILPEVLEIKEITVPKAVWEEVVIEGKGRKGAEEVNSAGWINNQEVKDRSKVRLLEAQLDQGEAEAIALANEIDADLILLDEKESREVARDMGLKMLGTVGVLIRAKKLSLINNLRNQLDSLKQEANFRISEDVYQRALSEVGET